MNVEIMRPRFRDGLARSAKMFLLFPDEIKRACLVSLQQLKHCSGAAEIDWKSGVAIFPAKWTSVPAI